MTAEEMGHVRVPVQILQVIVDSCSAMPAPHFLMESRLRETKLHSTPWKTLTS